MGNTVKIPLILGSDADFSKKANDSHLINLFLHLQSSGSKNNHIILNSSGSKTLISLPYTVYGIHNFRGDLYAVTSNALYKLDIPNKTYLKMGDVVITSYVDFADNGISMAFVDSAGNAYYYDNAVRGMGDNYYPASSVAYLDGYFIFNRKGTGQFFISKLFSRDFDALMFATAESSPDNLVEVKATPRELWLFGNRSIEVWYDSGNADFPLARIPGALSNIGAIYDTPTLLRESIYFVGTDYKVYETNGYNVRPISTPGITKVIADNSDKTMHGFSFIEYGHYFYALEIETIGTYVYDVITMQWHQRQSGTDAVWKIKGALNFNNQLIGFGGTNIYDLSVNYYDDDGVNITKEIISIPINDSVDRVRILELQLDMDVGFDTEGTMYLQMSKDGGVTWGGRYGASTGAIGENRTRVRWTRLGQFRDATAKIYTSDAIPIRIIELRGRIVYG